MATGDIGAVLDTLEFDTATGQSPHMVRVSGDVYACAYSGFGSDGFLTTFTIDSTGAIGNSVIDTLEFDTSSSFNPKIRNISGDVYAIVYDATGSFTKIVTVDIDSSGNIGAAVIDSFSTAGGGTSLPSRLASVSGDVYACAHTNPGNDGEIFTVDIDSAGNIGAAAIDTLAFDTRGQTADLINISGTTYAVAYKGPTGGDLLTFSIAANGTISGALDTLNFDSEAVYTRILNVSGDVYVIAYRGPGGDGFAKTMTIAADGSIGAVIDTLEFETLNCDFPDTVNVSQDVFAVVYMRTNFTTGIAKSFTVGSTGAFSVVLGRLEFESTTFGTYPTAIVVSGTDILCAVYEGPSQDGFAKTFTVEVALVPTVSTQAPTDIAATTATGNGTIAALGAAAVTEHGHVWATTVDPNTSDSKTTLGAGSLGPFTSSITGLTEGTKYFVRAYATNSEGTSFGEGVSWVSGASWSVLEWGDLAVIQNRLHYVGRNGQEYTIQGIVV